MFSSFVPRTMYLHVMDYLEEKKISFKCIKPENKDQLPEGITWTKVNFKGKECTSVCFLTEEEIDLLDIAQKIYTGEIVPVSSRCIVNNPDSQAERYV